MPKRPQGAQGRRWQGQERGLLFWPGPALWRRQVHRRQVKASRERCPQRKQRLVPRARPEQVSTLAPPQAYQS